jgi:hypothetical protein
MSTPERALRILLLAVLICALAAGCGLIAPVEPLPNGPPNVAGAAGTSGGMANAGGSSNAGFPGAGDDAGGDAGDTASAGQGGQSGTATGGAGVAGSAVVQGPKCGPDIVLDITDRVDPGAEVLQASERGLGLKARGPAAAVRLNSSAYRVFALDTNSHVVYTDVPRDRAAEWSPQWTAIEDYYQFQGSPVAVAVSETKAWVFTIGFPLFTLSQSSWDGMSWSSWSEAGVKLLGGPAAVATGLGNLLIVGRCDMSRICLANEPLASFESLQANNWTRLEIQTSFQPAALERSDGVHIAVTAQDGSVMYGHQATTESDFTWSRLEGMCFRSAPALISRALSLDLFGQGNDGALYWQSRVGQQWQGWVKISRVLGSAPLAVTDGADGMLVASMDDQGYLWVRRFANGLWGDWIGFRYYGASISDQPFPGSALVLGQGDIRLIMQGSLADLGELALTP